MFIGIPSYVFATEVNHCFFVFVLFDCLVFSRFYVIRKEFYESCLLKGKAQVMVGNYSMNEYFCMSIKFYTIRLYIQRNEKTQLASN